MLGLFGCLLSYIDNITGYIGELDKSSLLSYTDIPCLNLDSTPHAHCMRRAVLRYDRLGDSGYHPSKRQRQVECIVIVIVIYIVIEWSVIVQYDRLRERVGWAPE